MYISVRFKDGNMDDHKMLNFIEEVLKNMPSSWLALTTHRLDIYEEELAKTQFLEQFEILFNKQDAKLPSLIALPTAYDYIRLGHPLSCVLEWGVGRINKTSPNNAISFSSRTMPIIAILRKNLLDDKNTQICYTDELPSFLDVEILRNVYGYKCELRKIAHGPDIPLFEGSTILLSQTNKIYEFSVNSSVDFFVNMHAKLGAVVLINGEQNESYISEIQHVRRRESIAMTPDSCVIALKSLAEQKAAELKHTNIESNKIEVIDAIQRITQLETKAIVASSGLSIQFAIVMGLIDHVKETYIGKKIKILVPPNCYGGTNDQARRVAACVDQVEILDLPVDGENDMVQSIEKVLDQVAKGDAIPFIIVEIPTNPRVEVPDLKKLKNALSRERKNLNGELAIDPFFILDQTFCPNTHFLGDDGKLSNIKAISYVSGSKFPSGGLCTAGYCVFNNKSSELMAKVGSHLKLCDNQATDLQYEILAKQLPSMNQRIQKAYGNTREFVNFIKTILPGAKINFVSEALAKQGFTPSVFSLDLPTRSNTPEEKEANKRKLNLNLIHLMITEIPDESKFCVSYGQLKGCYWTIPATSTQGTTKEGDKDYIVRVAVSPDLNLAKHKEVFMKFVDGF